MKLVLWICSDWMNVMKSLISSCALKRIYDWEFILLDFIISRCFEIDEWWGNSRNSSACLRSARSTVIGAMPWRGEPNCRDGRSDPFSRAPAGDEKAARASVGQLDTPFTVRRYYDRPDSVKGSRAVREFEFGFILNRHEKYLVARSNFSKFECKFNNYIQRVGSMKFFSETRCRKCAW